MCRLILIMLCLANIVRGQELRIPFQFSSEEDNRLLREDDSMKYYVASDDSLLEVALNEENSWYRLLGQGKKVVAEGAYVQDGDKYLQDGIWTQKFENGKIKMTGAYQHGTPIGTWQEYYVNGNLKTLANYGIFLADGQVYSCLSGSYQEYFKSGRLKVNGYFLSKLSSYKDTMEVEDPVTEKKLYKLINHTVLTAVKTGHWEYYTENGELDKKEDL